MKLESRKERTVKCYLCGSDVLMVVNTTNKRKCWDCDKKQLQDGARPTQEDYDIVYENAY